MPEENFSLYGRDYSRSFAVIFISPPDRRLSIGEEVASHLELVSTAEESYEYFIHKKIRAFATMKVKNGTFHPTGLYTSDNNEDKSKRGEERIGNFETVAEYRPVFGSLVSALFSIMIGFFIGGEGMLTYFPTTVGYDLCLCHAYEYAAPTVRLSLGFGEFNI